VISRRLLALLLCAAPGFAGDWSARFDLTLQRILQGGPPHFDDAFVLADAVPESTRRFTNFSGDVSGRYIGAMATAARHTGRGFPQLERVVAQTLRLQKPDGHFGAPMSTDRVTNDDMAMLWGNGRMLIGLLEYYALSPRAEVLASARKLGDFLVKQAPRLNSEEVRHEYNGEKFAVGYICWTSNLEGLVELYRVTRDGRYLALAREIAARSDRHPSQHSHGFLSTVRGIVQLYRVTGERAFLEQAEREWQGVIDSGNVLPQGAVPEMFAPTVKRDEGCSEADWLRLSLELWQLTRDPQCLRQAELTLFNEFAFNQFHLADAKRVDSLASVRALPDKTVKVLMAADEESALRAFRQLVRAGTKQVYVLAGGIPAWLELFANASSGTPALLAGAFGGRHPASYPDVEHMALPKFETKVKLGASGAKKASGGCGG